ncbi:hypothetical protein [uncultured Lacinutrix sp.]|uniref:hypothetical protein n=1 Tax=uncultured Lacinutrix sp. TaxID=574032 RepID=UPI00262D021F|nr:hypothetical protein [uncultured Lacinutrix sp.]
MKNILLVFTICFLFSCENEAEDNRLDWIQEIDKTILDYNKNAKIEQEGFVGVDKDYSILKIFKKNNDGYQKNIIKSNDSINNVAIIMEIYTLNGEIVLQNFNGLFPLLYKGAKEESDPCCQLFERSIYYKNNQQGKAYFKQLKIKNSENENKFKDDLEILPMLEIDDFNVSDEYFRTKSQLHKLKAQL